MVRSQDLDHHVLEFQAVLGFPNAIGALDGCHLPVFPPKNSAVHYRNYKGWYSVILLALVDHRYRFRYVNVGFPGKFHDANVYGRSPCNMTRRPCLLEDFLFLRFLLPERPRLHIVFLGPVFVSGPSLVPLFYDDHPDDSHFDRHQCAPYRS
ncbi:hypothetical protein HPB47_022855 [Ixodes persulcatus]|uniref:Uncharacterized protein n=1 Tax=Ixodes persulcatus TaxID=34615 RepID=A0AC60Q9P0_IXOPE|nr:hypothetical protein HPB47_022855 [Ixodes persulcatus]